MLMVQSTCIMGLPTDHRAFIKLSKKYGVLTACLVLRGNEIAQPVYKQMVRLELPSPCSSDPATEH